MWNIFGTYLKTDYFCTRFREREQRRNDILKDADRTNRKFDRYSACILQGKRAGRQPLSSTASQSIPEKENRKKTSKKFGRYVIKSLSLHPLSERKAFVKKKRSMKRLHKQYVVQERRNEDYKIWFLRVKKNRQCSFLYIYKERAKLRTSVNQSVVLNRANADRQLSQKIFLQWRVWSWLRMNASYRPNTCKSRGSMIEACFNWWRPAHGWVTRIQPSADSGIAFRKKD